MLNKFALQKLSGFLWGRHFSSVLNFLLQFMELIKVYTLHLTKKDLSIQSLRDVICVSNTVGHYWIDQANQFFPKTSFLSAIYNCFKSNVLKVVKSKKPIPLFVNQFSYLETLLHGWNRFLHSKGPKNILWLFSGSIQTLRPCSCIVLYRPWKIW